LVGKTVGSNQADTYFSSTASLFTTQAGNLHNKMKSLSRIVQLLVVLYILFDLQFILAIDTCELSGSVIELSIMDGIYKINKAKLVIELYI